MNFNNVIIYVLYAFVLTTITGSVFSLFWLLLRRCIGEGNVLLLVRCLRISAQFYLIPFLFGILLWRKGDTFLFSPWLRVSIPRTRIFEGSVSGARMAVVLMAIWGIGMTVVFVRYVKEKRELREVLSGMEEESSPKIVDCYTRIKERLGIHRNIALLRGGADSIPCTVGKFRQKIILPARISEYHEEELELIFAHELMHCKRHDLFFKVEFLILNVIHAVNPLIYWMSRIHSEYTEIACDLMTCEAMGDLFSHKKYSLALLRMTEKNDQIRETPVAGLSENKSVLRKRIEIMVQYERRAKMKKGVAMLITALFVMGSSMTAFAAGNGIVELHEEFYQATTVMTEEETPETSDTLTEYTMSEEEFASTPCIMMDSGVTREYGLINWSDLKPDVKYTTVYFHLNEGDTVSVLISIDPDDKTTRVGLGGCPGVNALYVSGTDRLSHTFTAAKSGNYYVFIQNMSDTKINAGGSYAY